MCVRGMQSVKYDPLARVAVGIQAIIYKPVNTYSNSVGSVDKISKASSTGRTRPQSRRALDCQITPIIKRPLPGKSRTCLFGLPKGHDGYGVATEK